MAVILLRVPLQLLEFARFVKTIEEGSSAGKGEAELEPERTELPSKPRRGR